MKLTFEQIRSITTGAVSLEQEEYGIRVYRFNEEQRSLFQRRIRLLAEKMQSAAGIQFFFRTDSSTLSLRALVSKGSASNHFSFDLFVNGEYADSLDNLQDKTEAGYRHGVFEKTFALGDGEKEVCLYFPWSVAVVLQEVSLEDGAMLIPTPPAKKMLVYGDSVTHGNAVRYSCNHYIPRLSRAMGVQVRNKAIAGSSSFPEMVQAESPYDPDYVLVAYGSNDWDRYEEAFFAENYRLMMQLIAQKYPRAQVLVITPIWRADQETRQRKMGPLSAIEKNVLEIAEDFPNMTVIPGIDLVPHALKWYADAGLHPNDDGYGYYFENLWPKIKAALKD
jgi:lysophospholipase L1-like esterase